MRKLGKSEWIAIVVAIVVVGGIVTFGHSLPLINQAQNLGSIAMTQETANTSPELKITDTQVGSGASAEAGDTVTVNYRGLLTDGTEFDSSYSRGVPFTFTIGTRAVIDGWEQGIPGMKVGGKRTLTIPPELGYGPQAIGPIPANSTLIFEVELLEIAG